MGGGTFSFGELTLWSEWRDRIYTHEAKINTKQHKQEFDWIVCIWSTVRVQIRKKVHNKQAGPIREGFMEDLKPLSEPTTQLPSLAIILLWWLRPSGYPDPKQHGILINVPKRQSLGQAPQLKEKPKKGNSVPFTKWKAITELLKIGSKQKEGGKCWQYSIFLTNPVAKVQFATKSTVLSPSPSQTHCLASRQLHRMS